MRGGGNHLHFLHLLDEGVLDVRGHEDVFRRKTDLRTPNHDQSCPKQTTVWDSGQRTARTCPAFEKRPQRIRFAASARSIFGSTTTGFFPVPRDHKPPRNR